MSSEDSPVPVPPNRGAIIVVCAAAFVLGVAPVASFFANPFILAAIFGTVIVLGTLATRSFHCSATRRPGVLEFALAGLNMVSSASFLGLAWLLCYAAAFWCLRLVTRLFDVGVEAGTYGFAISAALAVGIGIRLTLETIQTGARQLYPDRAGVPSEFYALAGHRRKIIVSALLVLLILLAMLLLQEMFGEDPIFDVIALLYLFVVASGVRPSTQPELQQAESPLVEQIAAALEDEGFSTILSPQTGKPDVDPLIARLDIFAYRGEQALAVEIKHRAGETGSLDWRGATGLVTATRALVETPTELPEQVRSVNPLLVLVDDGPEPSLSKFCEEESIPLVSVRSAHPRQDMKKALPGILTSLSRMTGTVKL